MAQLTDIQLLNEDAARRARDDNGSKSLPRISQYEVVWNSKCHAILSGPGFAYVTILLFQLKKIWGLWDYRDLPVGDTASYFAVARDWFRHQQVDFAWSPLYTAFYGSFLGISNDAYTVTSAHRVVIVLLAVALVLAVLRQMVPGPIAWLTAAWWASLSINHNTFYEIHLFSLLPILVAWLVILRGSGPFSRGAGLAVLLTATFLVRNELIVAVFCWSGVCVVYEWRARGRLPACQAGPLSWLFLAYALPVLVGCLLTAWFYSRSIVKFSNLAIRVEVKHELNMAQVYAYGYQQRHPEWSGDPWRGSAELCQRDFGTPLPSFTQMVGANPRAAAEHLSWNLKLLPSGLQLLLFDVYSGSFCPDYGSLLPNPIPARRYSAVVLVLIVAAVVLFWRRRRWWWDNWFRARAAGWAAMLTVVVVACFVVPTQRPRPAYLFALGVFLMTVVATSGYIVLVTVFRRWPGAGTLAGTFMPIVMLVAPAIAHSPYAQGTPFLARRAQKAYRELLPYKDSIDQGTGILLEESFAESFQGYLGDGKGVFLGYSALHERNPGETLPAFLDRKRISFFRVNEACWAQLETEEPGCIKALIDNGAATGWWLVGFEDTSSRWLLFRRATAGASAGSAPPWRATGPARGFAPPPLAAMHSGLRPLAGLGPAEMANVQFDPIVVRWGLWPLTRLVPRDPAPL